MTPAGRATVASVFALAACAQRAPSANPSPSAEPETFAPALWNPGEEVFGGSFMSDGKSFYYFRKVAQPEEFRIFEARLVDGAWSAPTRLSFSDTTSDLYPAISPDGRRMVFTSYRRIAGDTSRTPNAHLWMVERVGDRWGQPSPLTAVNQIGLYHPGATLLADGSLYFRVIGSARRDLYKSQWRAGSFEPPTRSRAFESLQSDTRRVWGAEPAPDGRRFFLSIARRSSATQDWGPADIYVVDVRDDESWSPPRKLGGAINTAESEGAIGISPDGRYLHFTRSGRAVYRVGAAAAVATATTPAR